jgi:hypothetical protein
LKDTYNSAWEKNCGFVPMTKKEMNLVEKIGKEFHPYLMKYAREVTKLYQPV